MTVFNVMNYGAKGDGATPDTAAVKAAIAAAALQGGGTIYFPKGNYRVKETIDVPTELCLAGEGRSSNVVWDVDGDLFRWKLLCDHAIVRDLRITAAQPIAPGHAAFRCPLGCSDTLFADILIDRPGSGVWIDDQTTMVTFRNCILWGLTGTGIRLGSGSNVEIVGGRIIGPGPTTNSIGIHLTGNNGGVQIFGTDIITHRFGVLIDASATTANREVFLTHAQLDGCYTGLLIEDSSRVSVVGCWAASCWRENILVTFGQPTLIISGGQIFNCGAGGGESGRMDGLVVNSGSFVVQGVVVGNNHGKEIWVPNAAVTNYTVTGCKFDSNGGAGMVLTGGPYVVANNIFHLLWQWSRK